MCKKICLENVIRTNDFGDLNKNARITSHECQENPECKETKWIEI
jgi:hypothetical protein